MISSSKLLKAIRKKCLECSGGYTEEVLNCEITECSLYPYRLGLGYIQGKKKGEERE